MRILFYFFNFFIFFHLCADNEWQKVYLASFPRSGNHWTRYLIEEATHITTSSVYRDTLAHDPKPFPWGGYSIPKGYAGGCRLPTIDDVILIKTHYPFFTTPYDLKPHKMVIRVVRHPIDTFHSWYFYRKKHINDQRPFNRQVLLEYIKTWRNFQNYWNHQDDVYTIRYEDLLNDPQGVLKNVLVEIGYQASEADIQRAVKKYPPTGLQLKHLDFFSKPNLKLIETELKDLLNFFNYEVPID